MRITVPVECTRAPGSGAFIVHVRHVDCVCSVSTAGQKVGEIAALIGGGIEVEIDGHAYYIAAEDVIAEVLRAHRERQVVGAH